MASCSLRSTAMSMAATAWISCGSKSGALAEPSEVVYDNQLGANDNADPMTALGGGSIVVHKDAAS